MKILKYSLFALLLIFSFSCDNEPVDTGVAISTDDDTDTDTDPDEDPEEPVSFFPSTLDSEWNYDVANTNNDTNETTNSMDRLFIATENGDAFTFGVNDDGIANGSKNGILVGSNMNKTETTLATTGELSLPIPGLSFVIPYDNALLYDLNAGNNSMLSSFAGEIEETVQDFPLLVTYTLSTTQIGQLNTITLNGQDFSNVVKTNMTLNISVSTSIEVIPGFPIELPILDAQDVMSIDSYIAKEIGLVRSETQINFMLNEQTLATLEQAGIDLGGIPSSASTTNIQELTSYTIQ